MKLLRTMCRNKFYLSCLRKRYVLICSILIGGFYLLFDRERIVKLKLPYVVLHLDLKGAPPRLSYLGSLLPKLKQRGVNALLMEYEDMFPYEGILANLSSENCYKPSKLKKFLKSAHERGFEIIPLVQTFGHMESVLKLKEFSELRESPLYPDTICPSNQKSKKLIEEMLKQILLFHNNVTKLKFVHVGCDEVYKLKECEVCGNKRQTRIELYVDHLAFVINTAKALLPVAVLIWDDMIRPIPPTSDSYQLLNGVVIEPVYWNYVPKDRNGDLIVKTNVLFNYYNKFQNIWIASAFKGADGSTEILPNFTKRFKNHLDWLDLAVKVERLGGVDFSFAGIILTGWSRYTHMDPLCELLPVSLPSLWGNLLLINQYKEGIRKSDLYLSSEETFAKYIQRPLQRLLMCRSRIDMKNFDLYGCEFGEVKLYRNIRHLIEVKNEIKLFLNNESLKLSFLDYYSPTMDINKYTANSVVSAGKILIEKLKYVQTDLRKSLREYHSSQFTIEYIMSHTLDIEMNLNHVVDIMENAVKNLVWKRRSRKYARARVVNESHNVIHPKDDGKGRLVISLNGR